MKPLRLGTRGSQLALWQARRVASLVQERTGRGCELVVITTSGDRLAEARLAQIGGKRLFVKEIEEALGAGAIDAAVHSAKDVPSDLLPGMRLGAVLERADPRDAFVLRDRASAAPGNLPSFVDVIGSLGQRPKVGTSSVRRVAQLTRLMPGATFQPLRGNLDTRLRKLDRGDADVLVLAVAGLRRLGFDSRLSAVVPVDACVPAAGQGAIAVEIRDDDRDAAEVLAALDHAQTAAALQAERALIAALGGGCQTPVGALAEPVDDDLELTAIVTSLDGSRALRRRGRRPRADAAALGEEIGRQLLADGAAEILEEVRRAQAPVEGIQP